MVITGGETQEFRVEGTTFAPEGNILYVSFAVHELFVCECTDPRLLVSSSIDTAPNLATLSTLPSLPLLRSLVSLKSRPSVTTPRLPTTRCVFVSCEISARFITLIFAAHLSVLPSHPPQDTRVYSNVGEPTEAALKVLVEKIRTPSPSFNSTLASLTPPARVTAVNDQLESQFTRLLTFEFSRDRKSMSVLAKDNNSSSAALFVKGAPESVLDRCTSIQTGPTTHAPLSANLRQELNQKVLEYGAAGLRTLALAYIDNVDSDADHYHTDSSASYIKFEQNMIFVGLVGMLDPPRPEVAGAIIKCRTAGIRVVVITGDNKNTAETICRQIGVFGKDEVLDGKSYTGREFDALSDEQKVQAVLNASLFSRTEPGHKLQIVDLLQGQGLVCAMVRLRRMRRLKDELLTLISPSRRLVMVSTMLLPFVVPLLESPWDPEPMARF